MMRSTPPARWGYKVTMNTCSRHRFNNVCEQPYYLKPVQENPFLGTQHDGVSTDFHSGYTVKPIHHLYRFTHNYLPTNIPRQGLRGPAAKRVHWIEMTTTFHTKVDYLVFDFIPPAMLGFLIVGLTVFHLLRVCFYHPDITWYNFAFPSNKSYVPFVRFNQKMQMDQPVYRYFQQQTEFYFKDGTKRNLIEQDLIVNDPFINHVKEIGRGDELQIHYSMGKGQKELGCVGRGTLVPTVFQEKSSWYTPYAERYEKDPERTFAETHGSSTFWSLYTNLYRQP